MIGHFFWNCCSISIVGLPKEWLKEHFGNINTLLNVETFDYEHIIVTCL